MSSIPKFNAVSLIVGNLIELVVSEGRSVELRGASNSKDYSMKEDRLVPIQKPQVYRLLSGGLEMVSH